MNIFGKIQTWRNYRQTVNQLSSLSARELDDLGICRADIRNVAKNAFKK